MNTRSSSSSGSIAGSSPCCSSATRRVAPAGDRAAPARPTPRARMLVLAARSRGPVASRWREKTVPGPIPTGAIHHLRLTVTDIERSREFYTSLLGFEVAVASPPADDPSAAEVFKILFGGVVMIRGNLLMGLRPMAPSGDRFDPDRVGLDHLSFSVASHDDLENA